ncbi:hypothetical protein E2542_SST27099 [Spatholobus suberectus]|nr:hypothetical protein E2542_SST27099 [Spatholobus suberectus]
MSRIAQNLKLGISIPVSSFSRIFLPLILRRHFSGTHCCGFGSSSRVTYVRQRPYDQLEALLMPRRSSFAIAGANRRRCCH